MIFWILAQIALIVTWFIVPALPVWVVFLPTIVWLSIAGFTLLVSTTLLVAVSRGPKRR